MSWLIFVVVKMKNHQTMLFFSLSFFVVSIFGRFLFVIRRCENIHESDFYFFFFLNSNDISVGWAGVKLNVLKVTRELKIARGEITIGYLCWYSCH